jgi:hypothetical protein
VLRDRDAGHVEGSWNVKLSKKVNFAGAAADADDATKASSAAIDTATAKNLRMSLPPVAGLLGRR